MLMLGSTLLSCLGVSSCVVFTLGIFVSLVLHSQRFNQDSSCMAFALRTYTSPSPCYTPKSSSKMLFAALRLPQEILEWAEGEAAE